MVKKLITKEDIINNKQLIEICKNEQITYLGLFGSIAREEATENSDIDLLVRFSGSKSLFKIINLSYQLSDEFGRKVDLLTEQSISPYILDNIRKDLVVIYSE